MTLHNIYDTQEEARLAVKNFRIAGFTAKWIRNSCGYFEVYVGSFGERYKKLKKLSRLPKKEDKKMEKKLEKIKNLTPHPIVMRVREKSTLFHCDKEGFEVPPDEWERDVIFQPEGIVPRVATEEAEAPSIGGIPCVTRRLGRVQGLPSKEEEVYLIVSSLVFEASGDRDDLIVPDTGPTCVRDKDGRILAVRRFIRK